MREGLNWKELWVLEAALESRGDYAAGRFALVRLGNSSLVPYVNFGKGKVPRLSRLARNMEEREVALGCTEVALHIAGKDNAAADTLSRCAIWVRGLGPYPERELRQKLRKEVIGRRGNIDVDMLASGDGSNAWAQTSGSRPSRPLKVRRRAASCGGILELIWWILSFRALCRP